MYPSIYPSIHVSIRPFLSSSTHPFHPVFSILLTVLDAKNTKQDLPIPGLKEIKVK
jgi:hypothetical protein